MDELFKIKPKGYCKTCKHRQRWQCGGRIIQYCGVTPNNRTFNGIKKITIKNSCEKFANSKEKEENLGCRI